MDDLKLSSLFSDVNIAGAGFINISFSSHALANFVNDCTNDITKLFTSDFNKKLLIDYGGANIAKALHVGHLRSANIGEAIKRLAIALNVNVISDVHFGDIGRQSGMIISELKLMMPDLVYFDDNFMGEYPASLPIVAKDLDIMYPRASNAAKNSEERMEEVRQITADLENGHRGYTALWNQIKALSIENIKGIYARINTWFDLWEGESDSYPYIPQMIEYLNANKLAEEGDEIDIPPMIVLKSNGATVYGTRELATLFSRVKRFSPDEIWYIVDNRQEMYFKQTFRAAYKAGIVPKSTTLKFAGFGTMNGSDGKPFKTRDGGAMNLTDLIDSVKTIALAKLNLNITNEAEREKISEITAVAAIKFADLLPNRVTDYIFDIDKFMSLEGKTGPYLLYSTIRMKSLLSKAAEKKLTSKTVTTLSERGESEIIIKLLTLNKTLNRALNSQSVNEVAEYLYSLITIYNKFYSENNILNEGDISLRDSWLAISALTTNVCEKLIDILGIKLPERM